MVARADRAVRLVRRVQREQPVQQAMLVAVVVQAAPRSLATGIFRGMQPVQDTDL